MKAGEFRIGNYIRSGGEIFLKTINEQYLSQIKADAEKVPELLGWPNDGTSEGNDIKHSYILGASKYATEVERLKTLLKQEREEAQERPGLWDYGMTPDE